MFSKTIIDSDQFLDMPLSAQALYFHLSMRTDRGCDGGCKYDEKLYADIMKVLHGRIKELPSVPRKGKWIQNDNGTWSCNQCNSWIPDEQHYYANWCLYCGADMRGEQNEL